MNPRILLVEDNPINLELFTDLLEANGFTVICARDADTALRLAPAQMPDLILMDVALPGMDGLAAAQSLLSDPKTRAIPIVALTAHAMKGDSERAFAAGCAGYITKPINTRAFPRTVRGYCQAANHSDASASSSVVRTVDSMSTVIPSDNKIHPSTNNGDASAHEIHASDGQSGLSSHPSNVSSHPSDSSSRPSDVSSHPSGLSSRPSDVSSHPSDLSTQPSDVSSHPSDVSSHPSDVSSHPSVSIIPAVAPQMYAEADIPRAGKGKRAALFPPMPAGDAPARILVVDDDPMNREVMGEILRVMGYDAVFADGGAEALARAHDGIDLVLMDYMMPGMDGCETVMRLRENADLADIPVIMVTALSGRENKLRAVEAGASDFITKPVDRTELRVRMASLLKLKAAQDTLKRQQADLEGAVRTRTADLRKAMQQLTFTQKQSDQAQRDTMHRMALAAEFRDGAGASAHIACVGRYCAAMARAMGLSDHAVETVLHAAPVHDIGLMGVPDAVLRKNAALWTPHEAGQYRQHTLVGARILGGSAAELLRAGEVIAASHHERWDGGGYPRGLRGDDIPLFGRICAVADVFDTLTAYRPGHCPVPNEAALAQLEAERGAAFDPRVLDGFASAFAEVVEFQTRLRRAEVPPGDASGETPY